jgi:hypothetical protein
VETERGQGEGNTLQGILGEEEEEEDGGGGWEDEEQEEECPLQQDHVDVTDLMFLLN